MADRSSAAIRRRLNYSYQMKILSKYKDYYDFQAGIFGEDQHLVLDRREGGTKTALDEDTVVTLFVGNKVVQGLFKDGRFYWGKQEMEPFAQKAFDTKRKSAMWWSVNSNPNMLSFELNRPGRTVWQYAYHLEPDDISNMNEYLIPEYEKWCKPYAISLLVEGVGVFPYPKLDEIVVNRIIDAKTVWLILSDFLSLQKQEAEKTVPIGNDKLRIQSHGFDLKTSFRNSKA